MNGRESVQSEGVDFTYSDKVLGFKGGYFYKDESTTLRGKFQKYSKKALGLTEKQKVMVH